MKKDDKEDLCVYLRMNKDEGMKDNERRLTKIIVCWWLRIGKEVNADKWEWVWIWMSDEKWKMMMNEEDRGWMQVNVDEENKW